MSALSEEDRRKLLGIVETASRSFDVAKARRVISRLPARIEADRKTCRRDSGTRMLAQAGELSVWLGEVLASGRWDDDMAFVTASLDYYLQVYDMIPDSLGDGIGLMDDALVIQAAHGRVLGGGKP